MQQASNLRARLLKALDESILDNAAAIASGGCETMEDYRYMVGLNEAFEAMKLRINAEYKALNEDLIGDTNDENTRY